MSDVIEKNLSTLVRDTPLHQFEKKELTHYVAELNIRPKCGQVILHYNDHMITSVEQTFRCKA